MARANFKYEKRQKELAKQKKAEEKRLRRLEKRRTDRSRPSMSRMRLPMPIAKHPHPTRRSRPNSALQRRVRA
jgi:hypothetical protein